MRSPLAAATTEVLAEATSTIPIDPGEASHQGVIVPEDGGETLQILRGSPRALEPCPPFVARRP